ncbi:hypothetical protein RHCRD62_10126 [Rhodococcus sp. RD6.2]|nr:hypothetical protein RHCRD62_10126 [Rhodococcus sp. RD6.2]
MPSRQVLLPSQLHSLLVLIVPRGPGVKDAVVSLTPCGRGAPDAVVPIVDIAPIADETPESDRTRTSGTRSTG